MELFGFLFALFAVNVVVGYLICLRLRPKTFAKIFGIGLVQYLATAFLVACATAVGSYSSLKTFAIELGGVFIMGSLRLAPFVLPAVFVVALIFYIIFVKRTKP